MLEISSANTLGNPACYILIGPPACGKSTYRANLIQQIENPVIVSGDDLIEEECARTGLTYAEVFPKVDFKEQKRALRAIFDRAIRDGNTIIIDRTNMTIKGRRSFLSSLPAHYKKIAVVFEYDRDPLLERLYARGRDTGKTIPTKVVDDMIASFQYPADGEFDQVIVINTFRDGQAGL